MAFVVALMAMRLEELPVVSAEEATIGGSLSSDSVRLALAELDFDGADSKLEELRRTLTQPTETEELAAEVRAARSAWATLESALRDRIKSRKPIRLSFPANPREPRGVPGKSYLVVEVTGPRIRLQEQGAKAAETRPLFSLPRSSLLELAGAGAQAPAELKKGLGTLVLLHRGAEAARPFLLDMELTPAQRKSLEARMAATDSQLWLPARLHIATRLAEEFKTASPSPTLDALEFLASDAAEIMAAWRSRPSYGKVRAALRKVYITAREEAIKATPPERFFHAKETRIKGGIIELTYDFSSMDQLEDFTPLKRASGSLEWVKAQRAMKISGEIRFMDGNPFRNRISISGKASGFDPASPNVNVALWTGEKDLVTPQLDQLRFAQSGASDKGVEGGHKDDYFILGMGFKLDLGLATKEAKGLGSLLRNAKSFLPSYLSEPTHLLLACTAGKCALRDANDALWESSASNVLKSSFLFTVGANERGKLDWSINRRSLDFEGNPEVKRIEASGPKSGSLSLFTNGATFLLSQVKIAGELDPDWQLSRAHGLAVHEVRQLDGELSGASTQKKSSQKPAEKPAASDE